MNEMKSVKAPGLDGFPVKCLKKGGMAVLEWLVRLLNLSIDVGVVSMYWRGACLVPLNKGNGDKCECSNLRGISLLSGYRAINTWNSLSGDLRSSSSLCTFKNKL